MSPHRSRLILVASLAVLLVLLVAWTAWPDDDGSADLEVVAPITTTTIAAADPTTTTVPTADASAPEPSEASPAIYEPTRIRVPAIGVDAAVVPVGLQPDRQMEVPAASDVGWYRLGPAPGADGSAVMAAHVDFAGERGAFYDLRSVPVGAEVFVDGNGTSRRFVVTQREQEAKATVRLDRYFTADGPARLTLITCGGVFDRGVGHYDDNIIITAVPAD